MSTATSPPHSKFRAQTRRSERWRPWGRAAAIVAALVIALALVLWTNWMVQRYLILSDDTARGERFRDSLVLTDISGRGAQDRYVYDQCKIAAEAFYGHGIAGDGDDPAPPNEKAFFHACSGAVLGGRGGGGSD
jgi:hypothetical protein